MNLRVLNDRIFIKPDRLPEMTESGLHLVYDRQNSTMMGTVAAIGDGPLTNKGVRYEHIVDVGDRVLFNADSGDEVFFERDIVIVMKEDAILAVVS